MALWYPEQKTLYLHIAKTGEYRTLIESVATIENTIQFDGYQIFVAKGL